MLTREKRVMLTREKRVMQTHEKRVMVDAYGFLGSVSGGFAAGTT